MGENAIIWQETESHNVADALNALQDKLFACEEVLEKKSHRKVIDSVTIDFEAEDKLQSNLQKKELEVSFENARKSCKKLAVMNIICYLPDDIRKIVDKLQKMDSITLLKEKDFVKKPKKDGYRGYHIQTQIHATSLVEEFNIEIQIRTLGMDYWMNMQSQIRPVHSKKESKEIKKCADEILDMEHKLKQK